MTVYWSDLNLRLAGIGKRLDNMEQCLVVIAGQLGVPFTVPSSDLPPDIVELARSGNRLGAVKRYREVFGGDIKEAEEKISEL
jgi:hypothetical protein